MDTHTKRHEARRAVRQRCPQLRHFDTDLDEHGQEVEDEDEEEEAEDGQDGAPGPGSVPVSVASTWALCNDQLSGRALPGAWIRFSCRLPAGWSELTVVHTSAAGCRCERQCAPTRQEDKD